jgi:TolB-like protein
MGKILDLHTHYHTFLGKKVKHATGTEENMDTKSLVKRSIFFFALALFLMPTATVLASGNTYLHPEFRKTKIHDVGIITFDNDSSCHKDISTAVTEQFILELNKRKWYVVHRIKQEDLSSPEIMSKLDAVLKGNILVYKDYEPLRFGIRLELIDLGTNETLWSYQDVFDAGLRQTINNIKKYYNANEVKKYEIQYRMYLISMNKFLGYVFEQIIDTLR